MVQEASLNHHTPHVNISRKNNVYVNTQRLQHLFNKVMNGFTSDYSP